MVAERLGDNGNLGQAGGLTGLWQNQKDILSWEGVVCC